ncbi:acylphosphatase [Noviherbaspirillum sp. CPCC 100848]|uniref:acylphosphatase n=1 Tax=Noviherbaspirillum album TaxID=3080276 RepID=A0ABU6JCZ9_9BURK|nr:acylphosphatase [Noviherbaspirillum sp. CPCC 100848]MEC4721523.1 acylphosphatase [Noviherbaspirillum sp. CPCC 100848]
MTARHLRISGLVQGVGYRASFAMQARELGLSGWVRNRVDGSVEAAVRGAPEAVEQMVAWSRRGPPGARVSDVVITSIDDAALPGDGFEVLATQ